MCPAPANSSLLGQQIPGGDNFYLDVNDGDQNSVLNKQAYFGGSNYGFADGSLRYMKASDYSDSIVAREPELCHPGRVISRDQPPTAMSRLR